MKTNMTAHAKFDRANRLEYIINTIGIGNVVAEISTVDKQGRAGFQKLTDTGVIIILSADNKTIVTAYIATPDQACTVYKTAKKVSKMPDGLYSRIRKNEAIMKKQPKF